MVQKSRSKGNPSDILCAQAAGLGADRRNVPDAARVDVLVPTRDRPEALAVTLTGLAAQRASGFRVIVSDQSAAPVRAEPVVAAAIRILDHQGHPVEVHRHVPPRGMAEQRDFLLSRSDRPAVLFLDDDVWLEPDAVAVLVQALGALGCGFVGFAVQGLSYRDDTRPDELAPYEEWRHGVRPERVRRGGPAWARHSLHNAANPLHLARRHRRDGRPWWAYKVAWIGACVLYDRARLADCGGFGFWRRVPPRHAGEDVVAQLKVMERYGGAGLLPSRAYHLELPTTIRDRDAECYDHVLGDDVLGDDVLGDHELGDDVFGDHVLGDDVPADPVRADDVLADEAP